MKTEEEIIKALDICSHFGISTCEGCPYISVTGCQMEMKKDAKNIILSITEDTKDKKDMSYWSNICAINDRQEAKGRAKYGEDLEDNTTLTTIQRIEHAQEEAIDLLKYLEHLKQVANDGITANDYQRAAMRTAGEYKSNYDKMRNAVYGLNGESGEVIDILKKHEFQGHDLDEDKIVDECGDVLWYAALLADAIGKPLGEIMQQNVEKLKKRYPDGFSKERSIHREE